MQRTFVRGGLFLGLLLVFSGCQTMLTEKNLTVDGHFPVFGIKDTITEDHDDNEDVIKLVKSDDYGPARWKVKLKKGYKGQFYPMFRNQQGLLTNNCRDARYTFALHSWASLEKMNVLAYPEQLKKHVKHGGKVSSKVVYMATFEPGPEPGTLVRVDRNKRREVLLPTKRDKFLYKLGLKDPEADPFKDGQPIKIIVTPVAP